MSVPPPQHPADARLRIATLQGTGAGAAALGQSAASSSVEVYRNGLQLIFNKVCFEDRELQTDDRRVVVD